MVPELQAFIFIFSAVLAKTIMTYSENYRVYTLENYKMSNVNDRYILFFLKYSRDTSQSLYFVDSAQT
jgi:hypothetical protein